ncbi:MAG: hypothetical protein ACK54H_01955 [Phycisphaerales bacterium]
MSEVVISNREPNTDRMNRRRREPSIVKKRRTSSRSRKSTARDRGDAKQAGERQVPDEAVRVELNNMITRLLPDLLTIMRRLSGTMGSSPESLMNQLMATRLMKKPDFPRERKPFIGWVLANLKGLVIDRLRSETSRKRRERNRTIDRSETGISLGPELEPALKSLDRVDPDGGMMVRMRFFACMKIEDITLTYGVDRQTVARKLKQSLAYLAAKMKYE